MVDEEVTVDVEGVGVGTVSKFVGKVLVRGDKEGTQDEGLGLLLFSAEGDSVGAPERNSNGISEGLCACCHGAVVADEGVTVEMLGVGLRVGTVSKFEEKELVKGDKEGTQDERELLLLSAEGDSWERSSIGAKVKSCACCDGFNVIADEGASVEKVVVAVEITVSLVVPKAGSGVAVEGKAEGTR